MSTKENVALDEMVEPSGSVDTSVKAQGDLTHRISYADRIKKAAKDVAEKEAAKRASGTRTTPAGAPTKKSFAERAESMGLSVVSEAEGCFQYEDRFGSVLYRTVKTGTGGDADLHELPIMAIFTKGADDDDYSFAGYVSEQYKKFKGNDTMIQEVISLIETAGYKVDSEITVLTPNKAQIRHSIVLDSPINIPEVGDVHIFLNVSNSYDGTAAMCVQAGLWYKDSHDDEVSFISRNKLATVTNLTGSDKEMGVTKLIEVMSNNLETIITASKAHIIPEADVIKILKKIERAVGKRRSEIIGTILSEDGTDTAWGMFTSIVKFSDIEETAAARRWFENLADDVLVVPDEVRKAMK